MKVRKTKREARAESLADNVTTARVRGTVRWDDTLHGIAGLEVLARTGAVAARAVTGPDGGFALAIDAGHEGCTPLQFTVRGCGRRLASVSFPPDARRREVGLLVPGALRDIDRAGAERTVTLAGLPVDAKRLQKLRPGDLLDAVHRIVQGRSLQEQVSGLQGLVRGVDLVRLVSQSLSSRPLYALVEAIAQERAFPRDVLLDIDASRHLRSNPGDGAFTHDCGNFVIEYDTTGPGAVPPSTAAEDVIDPGSNPPVVLATLPAGGEPTYVKRICFWLERALAAYTGAPFGMRNPAAGGKIPVVVNTAPYGAADPNGTFYIGHSLSPDLLAAVSVHELFHMVQAEYALPGVWHNSIIEGGAVFAEDASADALNRYMAEANSAICGDPGLFVNPSQSLVIAGYDAALFWRYIAEQHSGDLAEPFVGVETYRALVETCEAGGGCTTDNLKAALRKLPWYQDFYEFGYTDASKTDLTSSETTFGNFALACTLKDLGTNVPDARFDFLEDEEDIGFDEVLNAVTPGKIESMSTLGSPAVSGSGTVTASTSLAWAGSVYAFGSRYYEAAIAPELSNVEVQFTADAGLTSCLCQIVQVDANGAVRDIHRSDLTSYTKRMTNDREGVKLAKLVVVVSGCETKGSFTLTVSAEDPAPDVMVTRWHHLPRTEYEIDSKWWAWTWVSPDVWVDNDGNGLADDEVFLDFDNQLNLRLHNKGNAEATGVSVEFHYCDATTALGSWLPVRNKAGTIQTLSNLSVATQSSATFVVPWSPASAGTSKHFCIRAIVTSPGDPNTDNKRVLSNFGNVITKGTGFADVDLLLVRRNPFAHDVPIALEVVPRLPPRLQLALRDLREQRELVLAAGEERVDRLRVLHLPGLRDARAVTTPRARLPRLETSPDPRGYYPADPRALPPGLADVPMVTVVHRAEGRVLGGVSFALRRARVS